MTPATGDSNDTKLNNPLVWIDLEMTGLDTAAHVIVEAAVIVTDGTLADRHEGPDLVIGASPEELRRMDPFVTDMHTKSGLLDRITASTLTIEEAEREILEFVRNLVPDPMSAPLAGNSVHADRAFLEAQMPALAQHLHYRNVDVSTIKELAKRWYPDLEPFEKATTHRALADIQESIAELEYYRERLFAPTTDQSPQ